MLAVYIHRTRQEKGCVKISKYHDLDYVFNFFNSYISRFNLKTIIKEPQGISHPILTWKFIRERVWWLCVCVWGCMWLIHSSKQGYVPFFSLDFYYFIHIHICRRSSSLLIKIGIENRVKCVGSQWRMCVYEQNIFRLKRKA